MVIGFDAPLPPAVTGVADYAARLLNELRRRATVVTKGSQAGLWLYHIGNNREHHAAIYQRALARPGVVVLHDAVLMHLQLSMASGEESFVEEFVFNYGGWHRDYARSLWQGRARSGADPEYFRWPMLKRLLSGSRAVVVHNPGAARRVREHAPGARVVEIPHLAFDAQAPAARAMAFRRQWNCGPSTFVCAVFGHLRDSKRVLPILRIVSALHDLDMRLVLCGAAQNPALERAMQPFLGNAVLRVPPLPEPDLLAAISACDAVLCLRWPQAGETSGLMIRAMAAGKPVLVTRGEDTASLPEGVCIPIDPGPPEADHLQEVIRWLVQQPGCARRIGAMAAEHIARFHSPAGVAAQYMEVLAACA